MSEITKFCPSVRDIFFQSDFTDRTTPEFDRDNAKFEQEIKKKQININELGDLVTGLTLEARAMGFEEGFAFAVKLLMK